MYRFHHFTIDQCHAAWLAKLNVLILTFVSGIPIPFPAMVSFLAKVSSHYHFCKIARPQIASRPLRLSSQLYMVKFCPAVGVCAGLTLLLG